MSLNKIMLIGRLGQDPEFRTFPNGGRVCNFSIATSETWKDKQTNERKTLTEWHRISVVADPLCDIIEKYVKKGDKLYIEGSIRTREYTDKTGAQRKATEVYVNARGSLVMLGSKGDGGSDSYQSSQEQPTEAQLQEIRRLKESGRLPENYEWKSEQYSHTSPNIDDELPF